MLNKHTQHNFYIHYKMILMSYHLSLICAFCNQNILKFNFFELLYINNMRGFHCDKSIHVQLYLEQVYLFHYISIPSFPPPFQTVFGGFHYVFFICIFNFLLHYGDSLNIYY
jgi:hypothetical protein